MVGWDITHLCINNSPATNVMMSMFLRCMERAYVDAGFKDVQVDFKVAGYYGLRTMRAYVSSSSHNAKELLNVLIETINRICEVEAPIHRLESSRNIAMTEKLDKYEKSDNRALETAWQIIGRGSMYDVANRINSIYKITAEDVMDIANEVFRRSRPSYIVASPEGDNEYYTLEYLMKAIKTDPGK
jgi:predicted Zn-dependent peptidase